MEKIKIACWLHGFICGIAAGIIIAGLVMK